MKLISSVQFSYMWPEAKVPEKSKSFFSQLKNDPILYIVRRTTDGSSSGKPNIFALLKQKSLLLYDTPRVHITYLSFGNLL